MTIEDKILRLIQWANVKRQAYAAASKVFETDRAKYEATGRLKENEFWRQQLNDLLTDKPQETTWIEEAGLISQDQFDQLKTQSNEDPQTKDRPGTV